MPHTRLLQKSDGGDHVYRPVYRPAYLLEHGVARTPEAKGEKLKHNNPVRRRLVAQRVTDLRREMEKPRLDPSMVFRVALTNGGCETGPALGPLSGGGGNHTALSVHVDFDRAAHTEKENARVL